MILDEKKFANIVEKLIKFKAGTTTVPIKDVSWEELIWAALVFMYGNNKVIWDSQSHEKSVDIKVYMGGKLVKISAKGAIIKNGILTTSSYRLTTFNNLEDKLEFIRKQHKAFDFYLICAREENQVKQTMNYVVIKVPSAKFAPQFMLNIKNWRKTKRGYDLRNNHDFQAKIVFKMSNQLWYRIPLNYFSDKEKLVNISIQKNKLGKGLIEFLNRNRN